MAQVNTRSLKITIDGIEYNAEVSSAEVTTKASESEFTTFADAAGGGKRDYGLKVTAVQDTSTASLWGKVWASAGSVVDVVVMPHGNAVPTTDQPHFEGPVTIKEPDGTILGGAANASTSARQVIEVEWPFEAKPVKVTA